LPRSEQPLSQLALVLGDTPRDVVTPLRGVPLHLGHDLLERLRPVHVGITPSERRQVRPEQEQHLHGVGSRASRIASSGTSSTIRGRPTSSRSTNRMPARYFLSRRMDSRLW